MVDSDFGIWLLGVSSFLGIALNLYTIWVFMRRLCRNNIKNSNRYSTLVASLAVSDVLFCSGILFLLFYQLRLFHVHAQAMHYYWIFNQALTYTSSMLHVTAISLDRYIGAVRPAIYKNIISRRQFTVAVALIWLASILVAALTVVCSAMVVDVVIACLILCCLLSSVVLYSLICKVVLHGKKVQATRKVRRTPENGRMKIIIMCGIITFSFFLCNIPYTVAAFHHSLTGTDWNLTIAWVLYLLMTIDCIVDALVYNFLSKVCTCLFSIRKRSQKFSIMLPMRTMRP